jgi:acyl-CoA thioesterase
MEKESRMNESIAYELARRSQQEPFGKLLGLEVLEVGEGTARVQMEVRPELNNIFGGTHGGALFSLVDEAFQLACNTHGVLAVALQVSITYVAPPSAGTTLQATARENHRTNRTASYLCEIRETNGKLIATAQALAYRTGKDNRLQSPAHSPE